MPVENLALDIRPIDYISRNFQLYELTKSETAARCNIDNRMKRLSHLYAAVYFTRNILQPVRDKFGRYSPNSVYRCQTLERALKNKPQSWISKSQHCRAEAGDIEIPSVMNLALAIWIRDNLDFDQLILECYDESQGPNSGWVHVSAVHSRVRANRGEVFSYIKDPIKNKYIFVTGLVG